MALHDWFIVRDGKETGPHTSAELKQMATSGELAPTDLVHRGGMKTAFASLPPDSVIRDPSEIERRYRRNVTALPRIIPMALRPGSAQEIVTIIAEANERDIPIYPISTGKNWGMGSKLPVTDGSVVLDLSRLNRIIEVNEALRYVIIEPGVTQGQLARHLAEHHPTLTFNLTGTFGETSILGNTLERGDGSHARIDDLIGLRGILGNGKPFEVGGHFGMSGAETSHVMRYAAGPDLVGLFSQSNFGVVTQMVFRLLPRAEKRNLFWGTAENAKLPELFDRLQRLFAQRIVNPAMVNVGYANRFEQARSTLGDKTADMRSTGELWNYYIIFDGSAKLSRVILEELREQLAPCCIETGSYENGGNPEVLPPHLKPIVRPLGGHPDYDSIRLVYKLTGAEPPTDPMDLDVDQTAFGMKSYVAIVPPLGEHVRKAADIIAKVRERFKLNIKPSFFGDGRFLNTIHFLATDAQQVAAAGQADAAIWEEMTAAGYMPYRVAIDSMERLIKSRPGFFALVAQIKSVFDPNNIIAPGRYCPSSSYVNQNESNQPTTFVEEMYSSLQRRLSRVPRPPEPIVYEFTNDRMLLHQYYRIREIMYRKVHKAFEFDGTEDVHDKIAHILLARRGKLVIGGCRLIIREGDESFPLPMECDHFKIREAFPLLPLTKLRHGEISRFAVSDNDDDCLEIMLGLSQLIVDKCVSDGLAYVFIKSPGLLMARNWRKIISVHCGQKDVRICTDVAMPDDPDYPEIEWEMVKLTLPAAMIGPADNEATLKELDTR